MTPYPTFVHFHRYLDFSTIRFFWVCFVLQGSADQANGVGGRSETDQPAWITALTSDRDVRGSQMMTCL